AGGLDRTSGPLESSIAQSPAVNYRERGRLMIITAHLFAAVLFENVELTWIWLLLIAAGTWLLFATYRGISQRSERGVLVTALMALRGAGLLALVLALAKPIWTREAKLVDPGHVAVVLDNSLSMSLADPSGKSRYSLAKEAVSQLRNALQANSTG